jgi:hypothetical protein
MKKVLITTLSAILIFLTTNCEKYVTDFQFDEKDPRLVLSAILEPDSIIKINVSSSQIFNPPTQAKTINNAEILLYEDETALGAPTSIGEGYYIFENHYPKPGSTYRAEVRADGFTTVLAETTIPLPVEYSVTSHGSVEKPVSDCIGCTPEKRIEYTLTLNLKNDTRWFGSSITVPKFLIQIDYDSRECVERETTTEEGYILNYDSCYYTIADTLGIYPVHLSFNTPSRAVKFTKDWDFYRLSDLEYESSGFKIYYSTEHQNNQTLTINLSIPTGWIFQDLGSNEITFWVDGYDESLFQHMYSQAQAEEIDGDPFAEKVQIYSNVHGGLGVFGAVSPSSVTLELDEDLITEMN